MAEQPESPEFLSSGDQPSDAVLVLLQDCLLLPEAEQPEALEELCRDHPECADELRACWTRLAKVGLAGLASTQDVFPERLGEFRLLRRLGGGGMGVVYLAEQTELQREVALKVIRPEHLYFPATRARFRREVLAVARLQHPGIVPVYSVGEHQGIPYFAMERVLGCTVAQLLKGVGGRPVEQLSGEDMADTVARLSGSARVSPSPNAYAGGWVEASFRLVLQVAHALRHAHQQGILHRDIKPSNIMLTPDGRALLLDFGLASSQGTEKLTRSGAPPGSLLYMSPEQLRGGSLDERTDVYSLGVTLYEMLTGREAFSARNLELLRRAILGGEIASVRQLNRRVPRDAETVCQTALDVDRRRRYSSADAFREDLQNFLEHRPIRARPAGHLRRLWRWAQRHPTATVALVLGALLLVGLPTGLLVQERASRIAIESEAEVARQVTRFLVELFEHASPRRSLGEDLPVGLLLDQGAQRLEGELRDQPEVRARLLGTLGRIYYWIGAYSKSERLLRQALVLERALPAGHSDRVLQMQELLGITLAALGSYAEAEQIQRQTLDGLRQRSGPSHPDVADSLRHLGNVLHAMGRSEEAQSVLRQSLAMFRQYPEENPPSHANALSDLASLEHEAGHDEEAAHLLETSLAIWERIRPGGHPTVPLILNSMARVQEAQGDLAGAEVSIRRALEEAQRIYGPDHPDVATLAVTRSTLLRTTHQFRTAERELRRAIGIQHRLLGEGHPELAWSRTDLGSLLYQQGRHRESVDLLEQSVAALREVYPGDHVHLAIALRSLAQALAGLGRLPDAEGVAREGLEMQRRLEETPGPTTARALLVLSWVLLLEGRSEEARSRCTEAIEIQDALPGAPEVVAEAWNQIALLELQRGNGALGESASRRALQVLEDAGAGDHLQAAYALNLAGWACLLRDGREEAEELFEGSIAAFRRIFPEGHPDLAFPLNQLGMELWGERLEEGLMLLQEALDVRREFLSPDDYFYSLSLHNLGVAWYQDGEDEAAGPLLEEALSLRRRHIAPPHPDLAGTLYALAQVRLREEDLDAAAEHAEECWRQERQLRQVSDPARVRATGLLGECWSRLGRYEEAEELLREAWSATSRTPVPEAQREAALRRLIDLYERWGRPEKADEYRAKLSSGSDDPR